MNDGRPSNAQTFIDAQAATRRCGRLITLILLQYSCRAMAARCRPHDNESYVPWCVADFRRHRLCRCMRRQPCGKHGEQERRKADCGSWPAMRSGSSEPPPRSQEHDALLWHATQVRSFVTTCQHNYFRCALGRSANGRQPQTCIACKAATVRQCPPAGRIEKCRCIRTSCRLTRR